MITIITVNFNSAVFIELQLYALKRLTKNPFKVLIADNGSKQSDKESLNTVIKKYHNVELFWRSPKSKPSFAHGEALDYLAAKVDTPYFSVTDADAVWLKKGWDEILINQINNKVKIIGTQAPKPKVQDFPLMFAALIETNTFNSLQASFMPKDPQQLQDTGYLLREIYLSAGYAGTIIRMENTRFYKRGPFKDIICAEYYLSGYPHIFASHFGRGSTLGEAKYSSRIIIDKIPVINRINRKMIGKQEVIKWLNISRAIIDEQ